VALGFSYWYPLGQIVAFKREVYRRALWELAPRHRPARAQWAPEPGSACTRC
jgi:hypothetical protein